MDWSKPSQTSFILLSALAGMVAAAGCFMSDIRDAIFFKPERARVEAAVARVAAREIVFRHSKGHFETFGAASTDALQTLAVDRQDWPSDNFQFDANVTPNRGLRIRALPRSEAVQGLRVGAQMFVAELTPAGGIGHSGWYP